MNGTVVVLLCMPRCSCLVSPSDQSLPLDLCHSLPWVMHHEWVRWICNHALIDQQLIDILCPDFRVAFTPVDCQDVSTGAALCNCIGLQEQILGEFYLIDMPSPLANTLFLPSQDLVFPSLHSIHGIFGCL